MRTAQAGVQAAVLQAASVEQQAAEEKADVLRQGLGAFREVQADEQAKVDAAAQSVQDTMGRYRTEMGKLAEMRVDPQRRYKGGAKIGAAIAMALGAYGAALARGPNTAMKIIQGEIDRDIKAQEAAIANQRGVATAAQAEVGMARQIFGDAQSQRLAAKNAALESVKMEMSLKAAESASPLVAANAQKAIAAIDAQVAQNEIAITNRQQDQALKATQAGATVAAAEVGAKQRGVQLTNQQRLAQQAARLAQAKQVAQSMAPPGLALVDPRYKPKEYETKEAQKMFKAYGPAKSAIQKVLAWRMKYGEVSGEKLNRKALKDGETLKLRAKSAMRTLDEAGANLSDNEVEMMGLNFGVGDVGYIATGLRTLLESITEKTSAGMYGYGYTLKEKQRKARARRISK
jgi:hypothetical protein